MPHIIVEYSKNLEGHLDVGALVRDLHEALADQGIDKARIKTRASCVQYFAVGDAGDQGKMVHATLLLLEGRDVRTKNQYGDALYDILKTACAVAPECAVTLEVCDMNKDTYYM